MIWLVVIVPRCTVLVMYGRDADRFITALDRVAVRLGRLRVSVDTYPAARIVTRWGLSMDRW